MKKKFLAAFLTMAMAVGMAGCDAQSPAATATPTVEAERTEEPQSLALSGEIAGEITVSCYETMRYKNFLDAAAAAFEEKYPGTKVNVNTFSAMPEVKTSTSEDGGMTVAVMMVDEAADPKAQSDYITQINTDMISGGGADIYATDVLPYYKYALNGQLEDLRQYMDADPDFNPADYRSNILDATKFNGGQYILPLNYSFDVLSYDTTLLAEAAQNELSTDGKYTYEQLVEIGLDSYNGNYNADAESPLKMFNLYSDVRDTDNSFLGKMFFANYNSFIDIINKQANFTDGRFVDMLNLAKEYEEKGYLNTRLDMGNEPFDISNMGNPEEMMKKASSQSYLYKSVAQEMLMQAFDNDDTVRNRIFIGGMGGFTENDELSGMLSNENGEVPFTVSQAYAMNANSNNKRTAWEFLKFLMGDEMQTSMFLQNVPVNIDAAAEKTKQQLTGELYAGKALAAGDFMSPVGGRKIEGAPGNTAVDGAEGTEEKFFKTVPGSTEDSSGNAEEEKFFKMVPGSTEDSPESADSTGTDGDVELTEKQQEIYNNYMSALEVYSSMLNSYMIRDAIVDEMLRTEIQYYFDGTKTADEVASALQNKIDMYLKE